MKPSLIFLATNFAVLNFCGSSAQERVPENPAAVTREDWQAQVKTSRARAEAMRREHRSVVVRQPTVGEIAELNSRRIREDDSLLPGDIISTDQGLFQFRGSPDGNRRVDDFVRIR
jgi:hypothetical protein